ncbi:uncharacterized protein LOC144510889 isoform X3 [Mustelus asterias]
MFKTDIEATHSKSVKSKKQIEINIIVNQNQEYEKKNKFKREKKKRRKAEMREIPVEASDADVCHDPKRAKKKKSKSKRSNVGEEEQDSKIEKKISKKSPRESEIDKDISDGLKKKKKRKKNIQPDDVSDPQNISEQCKRNICEEDPSRIQGESEGNKKKKRKNNVDMEGGLSKNIKTSNGTPDKVCKTLKISCVAEASSVKKRKKKKQSHSVDTNTSEDEKPMKKRKRDRNIDEPEAGSDNLKVADSRRQKDEQKLDNLSSTTDRTHAKKRKKEKLHTEEPERAHKGETLPVEKVMRVEQIGNEMEYSTKSGKKRKRLIEAEGEGIATSDRERLKLDAANSVCKLQNSPVTTKGKKQKTTFNVGESVETEKIKRKKKEISSGIHVCKVKEELCDDDDLLIMSEKKGNIFEVKIDKCTGTQWDTATFESTEQKNKFLRLMGGFKSSNPPQSSSSGKHNMALNRDQEEKFNRTLQNEFDRALNLRQNRGIGLGFIPLSSQSNKTFFIDKHASRSTKFDFD